MSDEEDEKRATLMASMEARREAEARQIAHDERRRVIESEFWDNLPREKEEKKAAEARFRTTCYLQMAANIMIIVGIMIGFFRKR